MTFSEMPSFSVVQGAEKFRPTVHVIGVSLASTVIVGLV